MKTKTTLLLLIGVTAFTAPLRAMFAPLSTLPIDRMVEDLKARCETEPDNALWTYRLGRTYYLAFDMGAGVAFSYNPQEPGKAYPHETMMGWPRRRIEQQMKEAEGETFDVQDVRGQEGGWTLKKLTETERTAYAEKAHTELKKAVKQDPDAGLYFLTLGSFEQNWLESGLESDALSDISKKTAMDAYKTAWKLQRKEDLALNHMPIHGKGGLFSAEAANAWLKLAETTEGADPETAEQMKADLKKFSKLRMGAVTPLIFRTDGKYDDPVPVNTEAEVAFDLIGNGSGGKWSWPEKGTAFLVWQPMKEKAVTGGRHLFGGYTWQMFWGNGFEPLALLDINRDGVLKGEELRGLAAWFDEAPLGISSEKELVPLEKLGVKALYLEHEGYPGPDALQWNRTGLEMTDGSLHPVWDWLAKPVD